MPTPYKSQSNSRLLCEVLVCFQASTTSCGGGPGLAGEPQNETGGACVSGGGFLRMEYQNVCVCVVCVLVCNKSM